MKKTQVNVNKLAKLCMIVAVVAIVFVVHPTSSYGQTNCGTDCYASIGYQIGSTYVLTGSANNDGTNLALGYNTLGSNTSSYNTAAGNLALASNTTGEFNTATGNSALESNTTGPHNTADGTAAAALTTTGGDNTVMGYNALLDNTTASGSTAIGYVALESSTGSANTALGSNTCSNVTSASNVICIGAGVAGANVKNTTYVGGIYGTVLKKGKNPEVCVNSAGQLGTGNCTGPLYGEVVDLLGQIQTQGQQIANLEQRLSQLESLIAKK